MVDVSINVRTDQFDGPLGLLLMLIQKQDMNIRELDLTSITRQYLTYLEQMQELNFDVAGDYLYLAVTLIFLKSKACLTTDDLDQRGELAEIAEGLQITSQEDLIKKLERIQHYQGLGHLLWELPKKGHQVFTRPKVNRRIYMDSTLVPMDVQRLSNSMMEFMQKEKRQYTVVKRDQFSVKDKIAFYKSRFCEGDRFHLENLLELDGGKSIPNLVVTFISLLELARLKYIGIFQNQDLGTVYINILRSLSDLGLDSVVEFGPENSEVAH